MWSRQPFFLKKNQRGKTPRDIANQGLSTESQHFCLPPGCGSTKFGAQMREINRFDEIIYSKLPNMKISEKSYLLKLKCFEKICKIPTSLSKSPLKISVQFEISSGPYFRSITFISLISLAARQTDNQWVCISSTSILLDDIIL